MFKVSDDDKLRVRDPLHKEFEGSKVKALDYVIKVNGDGNDMDPESLLNACIENAIAYVREDFVIACLLP